jgi:flagellar biosynthetic protein FliP
MKLIKPIRGILLNLLVVGFGAFCVSGFLGTSALAQDGGIIAGTSGLTLPSLNLSFSNSNKPEDLVSVLRVVILLTVLSLAPAVLIMMTSFTRIVVVLSFLRQSLGTQQMPPNQLIVGLSLFLTFFVMGPTFETIQKTALEPFMENKIDQKTFFANAEKPIREFMFAQTREKDLELFLNLSRSAKPQNRDEVSTLTLIPAFITSELKTSFQIGFMLYLPFLVLDMVVASVLMAMGMMMLPPLMISLPFKLLLFVLVDGWDLVVGSLVKSFN